ncbi:MAG: methyltransferase [Bacteroidetes bacterium]|nr:MAG: methyltransferase [Bacteroidota bacterium]
MIDKLLEIYIEQHSTKENEVLYELNRQTHLKKLQANMLSGHIQGAFLSLFTKLLQPKNVLEIGTYTGYSAIAMAQALGEEGKLITLECNPELESFIRQYVEKSQLQDKIELIIGDAKKIIPTLQQTFDLVFMDADKKEYITYYNLVKPLVKKGGYMIIDNVLWYGKVAEKSIQDKDTNAIRDFNRLVQEDKEVKNLMLPIRDGLLIVEKL